MTKESDHGHSINATRQLGTQIQAAIDVTGFCGGDTELVSVFGGFLQAALRRRYGLRIFASVKVSPGSSPQLSRGFRLTTGQSRA